MVDLRPIESAGEVKRYGSINGLERDPGCRVGPSSLNGRGEAVGTVPEESKGCPGVPALHPGYRDVGGIKVQVSLKQSPYSGVIAVEQDV